MSNWSDYITLDSSTPSRSGLYANNLPGVTLALLDDLTKDDQVDYLECWANLYNLAIQNFTSDVQSKLADKFHIDLKLATRETSELTTTENTGTGQSGVRYEYYRSKYAVNHCLQLEVYAIVPVASPEFVVNFYDALTNQLLYTKSTTLTSGLNIIPIDQDIDADQILITYDRHAWRLRGSDNKYYNTTRYIEFTKLACSYPCYGSSFNGAVYQIAGGGINAKFESMCSIDKFIQENLNIFKMAFYNRIAVELMRERILSDRFNRWTTLTSDRAKELREEYMGEYEIKLNNSIRNLKVQEDPLCFECKSAVSATNLLP